MVWAIGSATKLFTVLEALWRRDWTIWRDQGPFGSMMGPFGGERGSLAAGGPFGDGGPQNRWGPHQVVPLHYEKYVCASARRERAAAVPSLKVRTFSLNWDDPGEVERGMSFFSENGVSECFSRMAWCGWTEPAWLRD